MAEGIEVDKQRAVIDDIKEDLNVRDMDVRAAAEVTGDIEKWRRIVYTTSSSANPTNEKQEVSRELSLTSPSALSFTFCEITTVCCLSHFQQLNGAQYSSAAKWLVCWTQAQKARVQIAAATLSGNSLRQTIHTHRPLFTKQQNW